MLGRLAPVARQLWHRELVAVTWGLSATSVLAGAARGLFPYPRPGGRLVRWYQPRRRQLLRHETLHVGKTLRGQLRRRGWTGTLDTSFDEVVRRCADRAGSWITPDFVRVYRLLHDDGHAYSAEVWSSEGRLVGGLFGLRVGGILGVESMFSLVSDASKAALVDVAGRVHQAGGVGLDCQFPAPHIGALGGEVVDRAVFQQCLRTARGAGLAVPHGPRPLRAWVEDSR